MRIASEGKVIKKGQKAKANFDNPATPLGDLPPRESVGLNSSAVTAHVIQNTSQHLRESPSAQNPRHLPSRIFRTTPKNIPAFLAAETVTAKPADVNLLSRHIISI